jgi:hypothetical protein
VAGAPDIEVGLLSYNAGSETSYGDFLDQDYAWVDERMRRNLTTKTMLAHYVGRKIRTRRVQPGLGPVWISPDILEQIVYVDGLEPAGRAEVAAGNAARYAKEKSSRLRGMARQPRRR